MTRWTCAVVVMFVACSGSPSSQDSGTTFDAGSVDSGAPDAGSMDAGRPVDAGAPDSGIADAGTVRHVALGFSPFWADQALPFGQWNYGFLPVADFVSLHADDFFGVPFDSFATTAAPNDLPASWVAQWDAFATPAVNSGKPILLSVSPLADRSRLVKKVLPNGTVVEHWDPVSAGAAGNQCYSFFEAETPALATSYVNYLQWLINRYHPAQLLISIETDTQFYKCPAFKTNFQNFVSQVRAVVAATNPGVAVFSSFVFENFYANGLSGSLNGCGPLSADDCFDARVQEALSLTGDAGIGLSMYPQHWYPRTARMPLDRFQKLRAHTRQPIWVTETGWSTVPLRLTYASGTCSDANQSYFDSVIANEQTQAANVAETLALSEDAGVSGVVWWAYRDYLDATVASTCPCAPTTSDTCQRVALFGAGEFFYRAFGNLGLVREDGGVRDAFTTWDAYFRRPRVP